MLLLISLTNESTLTFIVSPSCSNDDFFSVGACGDDAGTIRARNRVRLVQLHQRIIQVEFGRRRIPQHVGGSHRQRNPVQQHVGAGVCDQSVDDDFRTRFNDGWHGFWQQFVLRHLAVVEWLALWCGRWDGVCQCVVHECVGQRSYADQPRRRVRDRRRRRGHDERRMGK